MAYTLKELNELTDDKITEIYRNCKNKEFTLNKLKNGRYGIVKNGNIIYENISIRTAKIEFIMTNQNNLDLDEVLKEMFGYRQKR